MKFIKLIIEVRTGRDLFFLVSTVMAVSLICVNVISYLYLDYDDFVANRFIANVECILLSFGVSFFVGRRFREIVILKDRLEYSATHDYLTGLSNRMALYDKLLSENSGQFAVVLIDVDDFKKINDKLGHSSGDQVLQIISQELLSHDVKNGMAVRFGGDEFLMLAPNMRGEEAREFAEQLRSALKDLNIQIEDTAIRISVSIGVSFLATPADKKHIDRAIGRADAALYDAKAQGRNRIRVS